MATLRHPLFLLCLALAAANQLLELVEMYVWPLHTHLDDVLALPITLTVALAAERAYFQNPYFVLPLKFTLLALLLFSVVFEGILPLLHRSYTADPWDVVAYTLGALLFHVCINEPLNKK